MAERTTRTATRASARTKAAADSVPEKTPVTRATRAKSATTTVKAAPAPKSTKATGKKPAANKENQISTPPKVVSKTGKSKSPTPELERENIMAFLRIRPHLGDEEDVKSPYLDQISDTTVRMTDSSESQLRYRVSALPPSATYTFSHIFPPETTQSDFFIKTTLPLVRDALQGQNALLFTYGVTNSGKTYTIQGGTQEGSAGILPRSLDVLFNSIDGLHGDGRHRPVRLQGVELADPSDSKPPPALPAPALAQVLGQELDAVLGDHDADSTTLKVDRNYEYTIWLSYAEVYNEKIYDLLDAVQDGNEAQPSNARNPNGQPLVLTRQALTLKTSPASDDNDTGIHGKFISGLRQFRVQSASQAKTLVKLGQLHRRVFGTLANRESSRSHGMVILKILRCHRGERNNLSAVQISRLTLVDLAGSERTKHTHTTGDRLREAGNINKSLMVLGQCLEVMRSNQRKLAMSLAHDVGSQEGRLDTRSVKKAMAVVPFRHSKLTESLMDYFVGDGRAVMIVNVNPYDTGYDENSHVMKFAALAREVYINPAPAPIQRVAAVGSSKLKSVASPEKKTRKVTISLGGPGTGRKATESVLEVLEVDEEDPAEEDSINPLVDALFDEVEELRMQLFESEMRCAMIETETREEVIREMSARMTAMQERHARRMREEMEQNELKMDAKIDLLYNSGMFNSPAKKGAPRRLNSDDELDSPTANGHLASCVSASTTTGDNNSDGEDLEDEVDDEDDCSSVEYESPPPTRHVIIEPRKFVPDGPMLPSDTEDAELTDTDDENTSAYESDQVDDDEEGSELLSESEDEEWEQPEMRTPRPPVKVARKGSTMATRMSRLSLASGSTSSP